MLPTVAPLVIMEIMVHLRVRHDFLGTLSRGLYLWPDVGRPREGTSSFAPSGAQRGEGTAEAGSLVKSLVVKAVFWKVE